jgi:hypothetical protein
MANMKHPEAIAAPPIDCAIGEVEIFQKLTAHPKKKRNDPTIDNNTYLITVFVKGFI